MFDPKRLVCVFIPLVALALADRLTAEETAERWVSLFNGKDLSGWVAPDNDHTWKVVDGVIDYEAKGGNLLTAKQYEDYVLRFEWRFKRTAGPPYHAKVFNPDGTQKKDAKGKPVTQPVANADSGVYVRGIGKSQVNLWCWPCGSGQLWSYHNSKDPELRQGALPKVKADKPVGEWNDMEITMRGERIKVVLNGQLVIDTRMPGVPTKGPIALQHHGGYNAKKKQWNSASALVQFRNLRIKELPKDRWVDLFNGKDFDGWLFHLGKTGTENHGTFKAVDGTIVCSGRPAGYLYTAKSYSSYTLEYEWAFKRPENLKEDKDFRGNSGCLVHIGRENALAVWPVSIEVQGMNRDAGRILPIPRSVKCKHTFDRTTLDKVRKPVGQWNKTVIDVDGGEMKVSINGSVVSTVTECELTEGPIGFQSEGKEIHWRNIRIRER